MTGDYDMWMVAPHVTSLKGSAAQVRSIPDDHGRSAALDFTAQLSEKLNDKCKLLIPDSKPVFNHGAEANNLSFTQDMEKKDLVVFCPGNHAPFLIHPVKDPEKLTKLFHDMLRHGYVVMLNPKWKHGFTLGSEDLAFANPEMPMDKKSVGQVDSARAAVQQLAAGAATVIQNNWRASRRMAELRAAQGRPNTGKAQAASAAGLAFLAVHEQQQLARLNALPDEERKAAMTPAYRLKDRAVKLRQFRLITNIPTVGDKDLIAHPSMFPYFSDAFGEATILAHTIRAQKTRALQESQFQRTGFVMEGKDGDQHLTPIDEQQAQRADDRPFYQALYGKDADKLYELAKLRASILSNRK